MAGQNLDPYSALLESGEHQIQPHFFQLEAIDGYFDDPRYAVRFSEFFVGITPAPEGRAHLSDEEQIRLRSGIGWGPGGQRVLAVFLFDLAQLTPRAQRAMAEFELEGEFHLDSDYYRTHIEGLPPMYLSAYEAVIGIQPIIDEIHQRATSKHLFRWNFSEKRPRGFSVFNKPTSKAFGEFIEAASNILVDNINVKGFPEVCRVDDTGKVKGSIRMLVDYLRSIEKVPPKPIDEFEIILRKLQAARSKISHEIVDPSYDPAFYDKQIDWMKKLFVAIMALYEIYSKYINDLDIEPPYWLELTPRYG